MRLTYNNWEVEWQKASAVQKATTGVVRIQPQQPAPPESHLAGLAIFSLFMVSLIAAAVVSICLHAATTCRRQSTRLEKELADKRCDYISYRVKTDYTIARLRGQVVRAGKYPSQFTDAELKTLISLVHPDKHGGSAKATAITQKLNAMRQ